MWRSPLGHFIIYSVSARDELLGIADGLVEVVNVHQFT
jgi:hypothetical protein